MKYFLPIFSLLLVLSCTTPPPFSTTTHPDEIVTQIAFGSCAHHDLPKPVLSLAAAKNPDLFIWLGDNIYGDTKVMDTMVAKYNRLAQDADYQKLKANTNFLATWDDHDFGWNDIGRHYEHKAASKDIFLDFWEEPKTSERRQHEGIYHAHLYGDAAHQVQVILLDTRTFRDDLILVKDTLKFKNDYQPNTSPDSTFLGAEQWAWLEKQLSVPAKVRIIASSNQFSHEYNGWESWTNVPHEQQKMLDLIKKTRANGVVFISGDVHWAELSKLETEGQYPIYDMTSSGINRDWYNVEPNKNRVGEAVREHNFGLIKINWATADPTIQLQAIDVFGKSRIEKHLSLSEISF